MKGTSARWDIPWNLASHLQGSQDRNFHSRLSASSSSPSNSSWSISLSLGLTFGYHQLYHVSLSLYNWRINVDSCDFCPWPCSLYHGNIFFRSYFVIWQNAEKGPLVNASCSRFSWDLTHDILQSQINWALVLSQDTQDVIAKTWNLGFFFKKKSGKHTKKKWHAFSAFFQGWIKVLNKTSLLWSHHLMM